MHEWMNVFLIPQHRAQYWLHGVRMMIMMTMIIYDNMTKTIIMVVGEHNVMVLLVALL